MMSSLVGIHNTATAAAGMYTLFGAARAPEENLIPIPHEYLDQEQDKPRNKYNTIKTVGTLGTLGALIKTGRKGRRPLNRRKPIPILELMCLITNCKIENSLARCLKKHNKSVGENMKLWENDKNYTCSLKDIRIEPITDMDILQRRVCRWLNCKPGENFKSCYNKNKEYYENKGRHVIDTIKINWALTRDWKCPNEKK